MSLPRIAQHRAFSWRALLGVGIGATFLYLSLRNIAVTQLLEAWRKSDPVWLIAIVALLLIGFVVRSVRWQRMFPPDAVPRLGVAFDAFVIGAMGNNLMPGRLGDLVRAVLIGRHLPALGTSGALANIVLEKAFDGMVLLGFLAIAVLLAPFPDWVAQTGYLGIAIFGGAFVALAILRMTAHNRSPSPNTEQGRWKSIILGLLDRASHGLHAIGSTRVVLTVGGLTIVVWLIELAIIASAFSMFGLTLPLDALLVTLVLLSIGTMLPAAPGFIGTYQFFVVTALGLYAVPQVTAVALGLLLNLTVIVITTLAGVFALLREGGLRSLGLPRSLSENG